MAKRREFLHLGAGAVLPAFYPSPVDRNLSAQSGMGSDTPAFGDDVDLRKELAATIGASLIGIAGGGSVQSAIEVADTPATLIASSASLSPGSTIRTADGFTYAVAVSEATDHDLVTAGGTKLYYRPGSGAVNGRAFGARGDSDADDTEALQAALDFAAKHAGAIRSVYLPAGIYRTRTIYLPLSVRFFGDGGAAETLVNSTTRLLQSGSGDVIRFKAHRLGSLRYWWGEIDHLTIWGDRTQRGGWGINFRDISGNAIIPMDSTFLHHLTIRRVPEGGINVPSGAYPLCVADCKFLFNNGPGIKLTRETAFQSIHFLNISGDGNNGGLINLNSLNDGFGSVIITNLKSEARVNYDYGNAELQANAIVCTACNDLPLVVNGATHTSSIPDGRFFRKPGDLVHVAPGGTPPQLHWLGVAIRVRGTDTGADPAIIGGSISPTLASAPYAVTSGVFNATTRLFNARMAWSRTTAGDGDTTPSVAKHNCLLLNNISATSITNFDDAIEGQELLLVANNANTTLVNGARMQLAGAEDFAMEGNDTCTLVYVASSWREKCRSGNSRPSSVNDGHAQ